MSEKGIKKLSVKDLIKEKEKFQVKDNVTKNLVIERGDENFLITIKKPSKSLCVDCMEMLSDTQMGKNADKEMVYNTVISPDLKDKELQDAFGCAEPIDIVEKIFEVGEIGTVSGHALTLAGYNNGIKIQEDLKN